MFRNNGNNNNGPRKRRRSGAVVFPFFAKTRSGQVVPGVPDSGAGSAQRSSNANFPAPVVPRASYTTGNYGGGGGTATASSGEHKLTEILLDYPHWMAKHITNHAVFPPDIDTAGIDGISRVRLWLSRYRSLILIHNKSWVKECSLEDFARAGGQQADGAARNNARGRDESTTVTPAGARTSSSTSHLVLSPTTSNENLQPSQVVDDVPVYSTRQAAGQKQLKNWIRDSCSLFWDVSFLLDTRDRFTERVPMNKAATTASIEESAPEGSSSPARTSSSANKTTAARSSLTATTSSLDYEEIHHPSLEEKHGGFEVHTAFVTGCLEEIAYRTVMRYLDLLMDNTRGLDYVLTNVSVQKHYALFSGEKFRYLWVASVVENREEDLFAGRDVVEVGGKEPQEQELDSTLHGQDELEQPRKLGPEVVTSKKLELPQEQLHPEDDQQHTVVCEVYCLDVTNRVCLTATLEFDRHEDVTETAARSRQARNSVMEYNKKRAAGGATTTKVLSRL
ncbi:unnamed protein product [Amoebophrya sp. A120]|nr:unnamed protein product [Amoebophrya sp. A120]|eukprot:GSA120T00014795001.1